MKQVETFFVWILFLSLFVFWGGIYSCSCSSDCPLAKEKVSQSDPEKGQSLDGSTQPEKALQKDKLKENDESHKEVKVTFEKEDELIPERKVETGADDSNPLRCKDAGASCLISNVKGRCRSGKIVCKESKASCKSEHSPLPERCNGKDDDCDGSIDNHFQCKSFLFQTKKGEFVRARGSKIDEQRNIYITGEFRGEVHFGALKLVSSGKSIDIFVAKMDQNGQFLWAVRFGAKGKDRGNDLAIDKSGALYIAGQFSSSVQFGKKTITSAGYEDLFFARLSAKDGSVVWVIRAGGKITNERGLTVVVDRAGSLIVSGLMYAEITLAPLKPVKSVSRFDAFVAKLNPKTGDALWITVVGGDSLLYPISLASDNNNNLYLSGYVSGKFISGGAPLISSGKEDAFIAKLDSQGKFVWRKLYGGKGDDSAVRIGVNQFGELYIVVLFFTTFEVEIFGKKHLIRAKKYDQRPKPDSLLLRIDPNSGDVLWMRTTTGANNTIYQIESFSFDKMGHIYAVGHFDKSVTFSNGSQFVNRLDAKGKNDAFVAKYDSQGNVLWSFSAGGKGDETISLAVDDLYLIGWGNKDGKYGQRNFLTKGQDMFIWKVIPPK